MRGCEVCCSVFIEDLDLFVGSKFRDCLRSLPHALSRSCRFAISLTALVPQDPGPLEAHVECHVRDRSVPVSLTGSIRAAADTGLDAASNNDQSSIILETPKTNDSCGSTASEHSLHNRKWHSKDCLVPEALIYSLAAPTTDSIATSAIIESAGYIARPCSEALRTLTTPPFPGHPWQRTRARKRSSTHKMPLEKRHLC